MSFINVGAFIRFADSDGRPTSKTQLKQYLTTEPQSVYFDLTAAELGPKPDYASNGLIDAADLADKLGGDKLSVCGPDPYKSRNWFATVEVGKKGLKIS